jgi:chorismate mutase
MVAGHPSRISRVSEPGVPAELQRLRGSIDNIDAALIHLLAERFKATQQVGRLKVDRRLPPSDPGREATQVARLRTLARESDLDPEFAEKFLAFLVEEVIRHHVAIAQEVAAPAAGDRPQVPGADRPRPSPPRTSAPPAVR